MQSPIQDPGQFTKVPPVRLHQVAEDVRGTKKKRRKNRATLLGCGVKRKLR